MEDLELKILKILEDTDKPLKSGEISEIANIDKNIVNKMITSLKKKNKIISPKRCYYSLNKGE